MAGLITLAIDQKTIKFLFKLMKLISQSAIMNVFNQCLFFSKLLLFAHKLIGFSISLLTSNTSVTQQCFSIFLFSRQGTNNVLITFLLNVLCWFWIVTATFFDPVIILFCCRPHSKTRQWFLWHFPTQRGKNKQIVYQINL